jgi:predicted amino acid-binding ACT domain protein
MVASGKVVDSPSRAPSGSHASSGKVIVTISGKQSPGSFGNVMRVLSPEASYELVDFGQLVIRDRFIATAVLAPPVGTTSSQDVVKDMIFRAHAYDLHVDFEVVPSNSHNMSSTSLASMPSVSSMDGAVAQENFIVTIFAAERIPSGFLADATAIMAHHHADIKSIDRLTEASDNYMCLEMIVSFPREEGKVSRVHSELFELGRRQAGADIALQPVRANRMSKRIVVFDLSWTLVNGDAVDVLLEAAEVSVPDPSRVAHENGELSGPDWLRVRVAALKGYDADVVNAKAFRALTFTDGAKELCRGLKKLGCRLAVVSSGSKKIAERAKEALGLHFSYGNGFEVLLA